jgi:cephalosporin hydroxylase
MDYKLKVEKVYEKIFSPDYENHFSDDLMTTIKTLPVINDLFENALKPGGHGGYFQFLKEIVIEAKPNHIVELGNREGMSTTAIIDGMRTNDSGAFTTIDIVPDLRWMSEDAKKYTSVNFVFGDCLNPQVLEIVKNIGPIDILFTDTIHTKEQLESELKAYEPLLADQALILIDDINLNDKKLAFDDIPYEKVNDVRLHVSGFGVVFYKRNFI